MKKILLFMLVLLTVILLTSCGETENQNNTNIEETEAMETQAETEETTTVAESNDPKLNINPADYHNVVLFELPEGDFRDIVVDHMREQANLKWVSSKTFGVQETFSHWGINLEYKQGQTYYGVVYSDYKVSLQQFTDLLVNGTYTNEATDWKTVPGVGCYSSILNSIQQFEPNIDGYTDIFMPGHNDFLLEIVGDYKIPDVVRRTQDIVEANGAEGMYEAYAQLKKGDIIFTKDYYEKGNSVHCRVVVEEPTILKNGSGKYVPSRCAIKTIEQTNTFDTTRTDGVKTTWYIDHIYTFQNLAEKFYVPITVGSYNKSRGEMEVPFILLDKEIPPELLGKKAFSNQAVKSNFPIRFVEATVLNKAGEEVAYSITGDMHSVYSVAMRTSFNTLFNNLGAGEYTFVLKAGISLGSTELARVDFTIA